MQALRVLGSLLFIFIAHVNTRYIADFIYWPGLCPLRLPSKICVPNPCSVHKCPMRPDAICEPNICGVCGADFFDHEGNLIPAEECYDLSCQPGLPVVTCPKALKKREEKCHAHPDAIFIGASDCHSCGTYFKFGRRLLQRECLNEPLRDENCNASQSNCMEDPCKRATCNASSKTLICVRDYCRCTFYFVDEFNRRVKCGEPIYKPEEITCQNGATQHKPVGCKTETCDNVCSKYPEAICVHECGSCDPVYIDRKGNRINKADCL